MFCIADLGLFIVSGFALNMLPGPDSLLIVRYSAAQGFRAGSVACFGVGAGICFHVIAAAFGLSAILATSAAAFTAVKIVGCVYLLYLGAMLLISRESGAPERPLTTPAVPLLTIFYQGFLTNILNPKVALFFLAFVPQFIAADAPNKPFAFLLLGLIFNINGMLWCHFLAWSSSSVGGQLKQNKKLVNYLSKATGVLFLYFGVRLALSRQV